MPLDLPALLTADEPSLRDQALEQAVAGASGAELLDACAALDRFRRDEPNLYRRVRALLFLAALHREHLPASGDIPAAGWIDAPLAGDILERRYEQALDGLLAAQAERGPSVTLSSALAAAYRALAFHTLATQVRRSVRAVEGNRWLFATTDPAVHPHPVVDALRDGRQRLVEWTPVRLDLSHSAWSDIFFLGMDHPEGARVLNLSVDLGVDGPPRPPIDVSLQVIDRPVLRLASIDLGRQVELTELEQVFDFAADHLGLLRAGLVAGGLVPPGLEGSGASLSDLLRRLVGPERGLALTTRVAGIPKGSRLAVSTNLLAGIISCCLRATGQSAALTGALSEQERRLVAARAILGEWLGGSGGGWQDSGGVWPGLKLIEGVRAGPGDPEHGVSRGRLLPRHTLLGADDLPPDLLERLADSLVLCHGGMAQDVGPVLEMVTERYLLRVPGATAARGRAEQLFGRLLQALGAGDLAALGALTHDNFHGPIREIIPWADNAFTRRMVAAVQRRFGDQFLGFWMLGGMSGGGMGLLFEPGTAAAARPQVLAILREAKQHLEHGLPFAMDPVVYDWRVNQRGTWAELRDDPAPEPGTPRGGEGRRDDALLDRRLDEHGFDPAWHEATRSDLLAGRIGLAHNRLPPGTRLEDVEPEDVQTMAGLTAAHRQRGEAALREGQVALVTLAGGAGSRWTRGAGVVKALSPFWWREGAWRSFLEVHRARVAASAARFGVAPPHVVTTSWLTEGPIAEWLADQPDGGAGVTTSPGRWIGLRLVPTERDLRYLWEESTQALLDEQAQKVAESYRGAIIGWARAAGEASDYRDNTPDQCLCPVGHGHEIPSLLVNGTLARLLEERPELTTLVLHNVDTLGADLDPALLGRHLELADLPPDGVHAGPGGLTFEVVPRRFEDRGGGLARVEGRPRLVESIALPREDDEWRLTYYNSLTTWIDIDHLLALCGLERADLVDGAAVMAGARRLLDQLPAYVTLKDVKRRWGAGHEDVFPVAQIERLWGDVSALPGARCRFAVVPELRGQQLKDPALLDTWYHDGSADHVASLCAFEPPP